MIFVTSNVAYSEKNSETTEAATISAKIKGAKFHLTRVRARMSRCVLWIMSAMAIAKTIVTDADK